MGATSGNPILYTAIICDNIYLVYIVREVYYDKIN